MHLPKLLKKGIKYIISPDYRFLINAGQGFYDSMPDAEYLTRKFKACMGKDLDLENPRTFNEKLQWLKLHDRKPEYTMMVDKYRVREYIAKTIGEEYLIPLLGVWDNPDDIDFDTLPNQFVLKCNHNSGLGMCICKDKSKLDISKVKAELEKGLKQNYYLTGREWPYKDIPRKIIAEQYMADSSGELRDYKVHCFNGVPRFILVCSGRFAKTGLKEDFYTTAWEKIPVRRPTYPNSEHGQDKPEQFEKMLELARRLAGQMPFTRVDFYSVNGQLYFGEITFYPASGMERFKPEEWDHTFGEWITLPEKR